LKKIKAFIYKKKNAIKIDSFKKLITWPESFRLTKDSYQIPDAFSSKKRLVSFVI